MFVNMWCVCVMTVYSVCLGGVCRVCLCVLHYMCKCVVYISMHCDHVFDTVVLGGVCMCVHFVLSAYIAGCGVSS